MKRIKITDIDNFVFIMAVTRTSKVSFENYTVVDGAAGLENTILQLFALFL